MNSPLVRVFSFESTRAAGHKSSFTDPLRQPSLKESRGKWSDVQGDDVTKDFHAWVFNCFVGCGWTTEISTFVVGRIYNLRDSKVF